MNTMQKTCRLSALSAALMTAFGPAFADDAEINELIKPDSSISVGVGAWSGDRPQMGIYDGMRDSGGYGLFDADVIKRDDATGTWYKLKAQNLGLESRELRLDVERQGKVGAFFEYGKTPREAPYTVNTGLRGAGTSIQTVSGSGANAFTKHDMLLGTERELFRLGGFMNLMPGLDFKIDYKNEDKTGTRAWNFGSQSYFLVEPVDSTIRQFEAILRYSGKSLQLSGGYYGSWFDQNNGGMVTANTNGVAGSTLLSQPLSNQAHQAFLDGGYNFTPTTRGTFKMSYTRATQDADLPIWGVLHAPGAPSHLDGKVDTTLLQLGLSSRPLPKLSLTGNLRYYDQDDKTPLTKFVTTGTGTWNTPQSFTKTSGKLEGTYRLPANFSFTAGVDYYNQNRSTPIVGTIVVPFRSELNELTYKLQLRRSLDDNLNGSIAYLRSDRNGSLRTNSTVAGANGATQNLYNPMHISDRIRDKLRVKLDWDPLEKLSFQFAVEGARDDYGPDNNPYGLIDGKAWLYSVDANYVVNDDWKLTGWLSREDTRSRQQVASTPINDIRLGEVSNALGLGLLGKLTSKLHFGTNIEWQRSITKHDQSGPFTATFRPLADIENKVTRLKLNGTYAIRKNADIRVDFIHEHWYSDDWTWNFAGGSPYAFGTAAGIDGTTVLVKPNQVSNFAAIRYIYKFQ